MSRPALAASRSLEIIELFTSFPERTFTFSEVIKATKINTASCHAILNVLTEKGYLLRSDINRSAASRCSATTRMGFGSVLASSIAFNSSSAVICVSVMPAKRQADISRSKTRLHEATNLAFVSPNLS